MALQLKMLTLNCWGVFTPLACQYRHERMTAIGQELSKGEYDIILLEEIWTQSDYRKLCQYIIPALPHTHYFHSGMFGTGVCIFSKYPIIETFQRTFTLNGYAHKVYHGDWFCGKGVGLAKISCNGRVLNIYGTHIHAQYEPEDDEYLAHRVAQAFEMSQFIKMTSVNCDAVFVGGDLNLQPTDLGYKIITSNASLQDAWLSQTSEKSDDTGSTCDRPDNIFRCKHTLKYAPQGLRIDFLLYRGSKDCDVTCKECIITLRQVPEKPFPYSDHEGVAAVFNLSPPKSEEGPKLDSAAIEKNLTDALEVMDTGVKKVSRDKTFFSVLSVICILAMLMISNISLAAPFSFITATCNVCISIAIAYFLWMCVIMSNWELNGLTAVKKDISNLLKSNPLVLDR